MYLINAPTVAILTRIYLEAYSVKNYLIKLAVCGVDTFTGKKQLTLGMTVSFIIPYRNREVPEFRLSLESLCRQTDTDYEVVLVDVKSDERFTEPMESLCKEYGVNYHRLNLLYSPRELEIDLWSLFVNYGFRQAKGDLMVYGGIDRIYERNTVENIRKAYAHHAVNGRPILVSARVHDLDYTPSLGELDDFNALFNKAKWRGGYGYLGSSREWIHRVRGLDELTRWCSDIDLAKRCAYDGGATIWTSHGRATYKGIVEPNRIIHLANHGKPRRRYPKMETLKVVKRSRLIMMGEKSVIRNSPDWGVLTEEHIRGILNAD